MKIKEYLWDKFYFIIFLIMVLVFVSMIIGDIDKIIYIITISLIFAIIYLSIEYMVDYKFFKELKYIVKNENLDQLISIGNALHARTQEQVLYLKLIENINKIQQNEILKFHNRQKEYEEYIETWVHEIKTPIACGKLIVEKDPFDKNLISMEEELDEITQYVDQALYYAKKDSVAKDYFIKEIKLQKIVSSVLKEKAKQIIEKNISIEMDGLENIVLTDEKWMGFIVNQCIQNSIKYTESNKGIIKIYGIHENNKTTLIIEDNGIGIKNEDLGRVFDKGFTGNTGRKLKKSTGIGLYLVKQLSEKLGHRVTIESEIYKYTKVMIDFYKISSFHDITKM